MIRQVSQEAIEGHFEDVATLLSAARSATEGFGVVFADAAADFDEPGPTQWAVVALPDERQYLLVHHHAHPDSFIDLRASVDEPNAEEAVKAFVQAFELPDDEVSWIIDASHWPLGRPQ